MNSNLKIERTHQVLLHSGYEPRTTAEELIKGIELEEMNLIDPVSISLFAQKFMEANEELHLLINCVGIMLVSEKRDSRWYELQFATNHLGHFQLAARVWPA